VIQHILRVRSGAALAIAAVLALSPGASADGSHRYCNSVVPAKSPCSVSYINLVYFQKVRYDGRGSVPVCERAVLQTSQRQISRRCSVGSANYIDSDYDLQGYAWDLNPIRVTCGNDSNYDHTIICDTDYYS
jgi:hypothetical protein